MFSNRGALSSVLRFGALIVCLLVYPSYLFVKVLRMRVMTSGVSLTLLSDRVFVGTSGLHLDFVTLPFISRCSLLYHPITVRRCLARSSTLSGFVKKSAGWSSVPILCMLMDPSFT